MENSPKELPIKFEGTGEVKGFSFIQVKRSDSAYIYEVSDTFGNKWYEVFKRSENVRFAQIAYPKSKAFGIWAWSAETIEKAKERFEKLEKNNRQVSNPLAK